MNHYEQKVEAKRERYAELATKRQAQSDDAYKTARQIGDMIPFGQPILVGHHSERGHRNAISKIDTNMRKSIDLQDKANYYAEKAQNYGKSGISSDDPAVVIKLKEKLTKAQEEHNAYKKHNIDARKTGEAKLPSYVLSNSNGRIRAIKKRIEGLERKENREALPTVNGDGWTFKEYRDENRLMFIFDGKPDESTRSLLKKRAYKWSPSRNAWTRKTTPNAMFATRQLFKELKTKL